jgi:hypothetical protein
MDLKSFLDNAYEKGEEVFIKKHLKNLKSKGLDVNSRYLDIKENGLEYSKGFIEGYEAAYSILNRLEKVANEEDKEK